MVTLEEMQLVDKIHNIVFDNSQKGDTKFWSVLRYLRYAYAKPYLDGVHEQEDKFF